MNGGYGSLLRRDEQEDETDDRPAQARRHASASQWSRDRDRASDPPAMARLGHCREHNDARRSPQRALHYRGRQACDGARWPAGATPRSWPGHWVLHGFGMFVVEEKASGTFVGRVGPFYPPGWPGLRSAGASPRNSVARAMRSKRRGPSIDWAFATFDIEQNHPLHRSREHGVSSRRAAVGCAAGGRDDVTRPCR